LDANSAWNGPYSFLIKFATPVEQVHPIKTRKEP